MVVHLALNAHALFRAQAVFYPRVDVYSVLEIKDYNLNGRNSSAGASDIWVAVEGNAVKGQNRNFDWIEHTKPLVRGGSVVPFLTAIVHMRDGVVQRVQWDSGCHTCSSANSVECVPDGTDVVCGSGSEPLGCSDCAASITDQCTSSTSCIPRVYIAWIGSDVNGVPCNSAGAPSSAPGMPAARSWLSGPVHFRRNLVPHRQGYLEVPLLLAARPLGLRVGEQCGADRWHPWRGVSRRRLGPDGILHATGAARLSGSRPVPVGRSFPRGRGALCTYMFQSGKLLFRVKTPPRSPSLSWAPLRRTPVSRHPC